MKNGLERFVCAQNSKCCIYPKFHRADSDLSILIDLAKTRDSTNYKNERDGTIPGQFKPEKAELILRKISVRRWI